MYNEFIYELEQEWSKYQTLINTKEILTQEEYEFCVEWDAAEAWKYLNNIGEGRWLNINVYSEHEHEEFQLRMEQGL
jgi:hypothetical protein